MAAAAAAAAAATEPRGGDGAKPRVYRLRRLPRDADRLRVVEILSRSMDGVAAEDVQIGSLANAVDPWEETPTKTATLTFRRPPAALQGMGGKWELPIIVVGLKQPLIIDAHFHGFTPLNDAVPGGHGYDCIAISGLASHPFGSWQPHGGDKSFMWIRDAMPASRPGTRFLIYGYDTELVGSRSFQSIADLAGTLVSELKATGWARPTSKPLVFLAHSLGGVVLKQALVMLAGSGEREKFILSQTRGAIFFGVPSYGMATSHLLAMVKDQPNRILVNDLSEESSYLRGLGKQFDGISCNRHMRLFWAYETLKSPTAMELPDGSFAKVGTEVVLVKKESATNNCDPVREVDSTLQLNENHSDMVKFGQGDHRLSTIASKLADIEDEGGLQTVEVPGAPKRSPDRRLPAHPPGGHETTSIWDYPTRAASSIALEDQSWTSWGAERWDLDAGMLGGFRLSRDDSEEGRVSFQIRLSPPRPPPYEKSLTPDAEVVESSLHVPERDRRLEQIGVAEKHTFEWVFESSFGLADWLRTGDGVFWISGKPGSGKSTLMKFIYHDSRTAQLLHKFGSTTTHLWPAFFFHHRGDVIQKSFEGLLRGILSQIFETRSHLKPILGSILERRFRERVDDEGLGSLVSDIVVLLERCGETNIVEALQDRAIVAIVKSRQNARFESDKFFGMFLRGLPSDTGAAVSLELLRRRDSLLVSKGAELKLLLEGICTRHGLNSDESSVFYDLVAKWRERPDLGNQLRQLLNEREIQITEDTERRIRYISDRQRTRECIQREVQTEPWTTTTLKDALLDVLRQTTTELDITLFLDAVDEYDGPVDFISTFLKDLTQQSFPMTRIRICCSSRPWATFAEQFGTCPGFRIHEHTEGDIRQYCTATIDYGLQSAGLLNDLIPEIVQRAQGVFIWVRLVISDLTKVAMAEKGTMAEIRAKLTSTLKLLPDQLDEYYRTIIDRIPENLRWNTYVMLEVLLRFQGALPAKTLFEVLACSTVVGAQDSQRKTNWWHSATGKELETQLWIYSGGLVEVFRILDNDSLLCAQLMHQTVKDFIERPDFKHFVLGEQGKVTPENGDTFLAWWAIMQMGDRVQTTRFRYRNFLVHARLSELATGRSIFGRVSSVGIDTLSLKRTHSISVTDIGETLSPLLLAVYCGLRLYLQDAFAADEHVFRRSKDSLYEVLLSATSESILLAEVAETARYITGHGFSVSGDALGRIGSALKLHYTQEHFLSDPALRCEVLITMIITAFESSTDVNVTVPIKIKLDHSNYEEYWGTMVHVWAHGLTHYLLEKGANANALSSTGETPFDRLVAETSKGIYVYGVTTRTFWEDTYSIILLLGQHNGKFCKRSKAEVKEFRWKLGQQLTTMGLDADIESLSGIVSPQFIKPTRHTFSSRLKGVFSNKPTG